MVHRLWYRLWHGPPDITAEVFNEYEQCIQKMDYENKEIILYMHWYESRVGTSDFGLQSSGFGFRICNRTLFNFL